MAADEIVAAAYVRKIKNPAKHAYGVAYLAYLAGEGEQPDRPSDLSVMGAQAVRLHLADVFAGRS